MKSPVEKSRIAGKPLPDRTEYNRNREMTIQKPFAQIKEINVDFENDNIVRIYKHSPNDILFQIRTFDPITDSNAGKPRNMIAHATLTLDEWEAIDDHVRQLFGQNTYGRLVVGTYYRPYGLDKQGGKLVSTEQSHMSNIHPKWDIITLELDDGTTAKFYRKDLEGKEGIS